MNRKDELEEIIDKAREELSKIEADENRKKGNRLVGRFFKFRNSYSCPKPDEHWWVYMLVTGISESGMVEVFSFQTDFNGKTTIEDTITFAGSSHVEITANEFATAWASLMSKLSLKDGIAYGR